MMTEHWNALILAASRGPEDPMAKAYGVANKCTITIAGRPMLWRVAEALRSSGVIGQIAVSIEDPKIVNRLLGDRAVVLTAAGSAPASVMAAIAAGQLAYPMLVTTGDHALLTPEMVRHFCVESMAVDADFTAGLASAEIILAAYPESVRTFFTLGPDRVSGCNLFGLKSARALRLLDRWQYLEQARKKPWRLIAAFGTVPLLRYLTGHLDLEQAFAIVSDKLGLLARPVMMPFAEAAIDVDKPADKELAERIAAQRG
jgi:GTP:adenosylcobinamide-phosphate guanylyltransferase